MAKREARKRLTTLPPSAHQRMTGAEMFKALVGAGRWSYPQIAHELGMKTDNSVKSWTSGRGQPNIYIPKIEEFVHANAASKTIANAWWSALVAAWERDARAKREKRKQNRRRRSAITDLVKNLQELIGQDRRLTRMPALFETDRSFPLADAYVELRVAPAKAVVPMPQVLEQRCTLAERIQRRAEQRYAVRRAPQDALDRVGVRCRLILGAPGSGKSSLLRRLALDIAAGEWETAAVPLFVEARAYAESRRTQPTLSLIDYACQTIGKEFAERVRALLTDAGTDAQNRAILLVDGLDEIASDRDAVSAVYGTLADSSNGVMWIATARPAGLVRACGEDQRYEMAELDADAIDKLIKNWCQASSKAGLPLDPLALRWELDRVPGIREMSTSPFLLTALCFLKSKAPDEELPNSRIAVYEQLLERIAHQAQVRHSDPTILSEQALRDLSEFACFLYKNPHEDLHGAIQIFGASLWREFIAQSQRAVDTDFARQILPARLLTVWNEADPQYHFLHLTLQEHLIAQAIIDWPIAEVLRYRFFPAWRPVFRFYGALLWQRGRREAFAELTTALFQSRDINELTLITLAEIFSDAGLRDTITWLGVDLREAILSSVRADHAVGMEAFIDALALLDPDWLTARTIEDAESLVAVTVEAARTMTEEEDFPGHLSIVSGRDFGSPYLRMARARTGSGKAAIEEAFWGQDQTRAAMAAVAYADIATSEQKSRVVQAASSVSISNGMALRFYAFALASRSGEFLPFLDRWTEHLAAKRKNPFFEAMSLVADIGGPKARSILKKRLLYELRRHDHRHLIELCVRAATQLGGREAVSILKSALDQAPSDRWRLQLRFVIDAITADSTSHSDDHLADPEASSVRLGALADAASFGVLPSRKVIEAIKAYAAEARVTDAFNLAILERHMLDAGESPQLCGPLLAIATGMLSSLKDPKIDPASEQGVKVGLRLVLEVLGQARWVPARELAQIIINDQSLPTDVVEAAITMAGLILKQTGDEGMLLRLEQILYDESCYLDPYEVTLAIGRIKLERLFQLRGASTAASTLQQIAAENDYLIFEDYWVDRAGKTTQWKSPPRKVLYTASKSRQKIADVISHELSRWGLYLTGDCPPESCVAALIIEPLGECDRAFDGTQLRILEADGAKTYRISADVDRDAARQIARTIGSALGSSLPRPRITRGTQPLHPGFPDNRA